MCEIMERRGYFERPNNDRSEQRPRIIGYYSVDEHKNYIPDSSKLKYFKPPKRNFGSFDLNDGRDISVCKLEPVNTGNTTRWSGILKWIESNREKVKASPKTDRLLQPNFVSTPGSLVPFMAAPYSWNDWKVWAGKFEGTIYLRNDYCRVPDEKDKKFGIWGHKFEQYVVSDSPHKDPDTTKPIENQGEFRCVYEHQFSNYSVLYSAVRKAAFSNKILEDPLPLDELKFVDLRTNKLTEHAGHEKSLKRHKFLNWWANAFLTNDNKVLCGFRDENGLVSYLKTYKTEYMVTASRGLWDPKECLKSCEMFLSKVARTVLDDCNETIYELTKKSNEDFNVKEWKPSEKYCPVPEWYRKAIAQ